MKVFNLLAILAVLFFPFVNDTKSDNEHKNHNHYGHGSHVEIPVGVIG